MRVHETATAQLLDAETPIANRQNQPALRVVILGGPGDQRKIVHGGLVGVHETAVALLADRVDGAHLAENPALGIVVLGQPGNDGEIVRGDLMGVNKAAVALLADCERTSAQGADWPPGKLLDRTSSFFMAWAFLFYTTRFSLYSEKHFMLPIRQEV